MGMIRLFGQIYEDDNENDVDAKAEGKHENLFPKKINGHHTFSAYRNFRRLLMIFSFKCVTLYCQVTIVFMTQLSEMSSSKHLKKAGGEPCVICIELSQQSLDI